MKSVICLLVAMSEIAAQPQALNWTAEQDRQNMMDQLGIKTLRPGPSGDETKPNHANYDESKANPFTNLPDALTLRSGKSVTTAEMWLKQRRPEIVEDFEREVLGRVPKNVPKVTWTSRTQQLRWWAHIQPSASSLWGTWTILRIH
jgi:hypothetical protein